MALEDRVERLTSTLERMLDNGAFSGGRSGATGSTGGTGGGTSAAGIAQGTGNFLNTLGQAAQGNLNFAGALKEVTAVMGHFGPVGQVIGAVTQSVGANLVEMNQNMMASSRFGMGFSQNLGQFAEELGKAGIGQQQWVNLLQSNAKYLSGSASSAQESAQLFLKQAQELRSEKQVQQAMLSGIDFSEFTDQLLISTNLLKFQGIETQRTQKILQESVVTTVAELDNMARITGKSRQEIQKGIDQQQQSNQMRIARLSMSAEQLARYNESLPKITSYGQGFANLFTEMSANRGNVVTKEGTEMQAALNILAPQVGGLMRELSQETNAERRKELQAKIDYEMALAVSDEKRMERFNALATNQTAGVRQAVETLMQGEGLLAAYKEMLAKTNGTFADFRKINDEARAKAEKERQPAGAGATPGNQLSTAINAAEAATKTISAGLAMGLKEGFDKLGKDLQTSMNPANYLKAFSIQAITPDELEKRLKSAINYTGVDTGPGSANRPSQALQDRLGIKSNPMQIEGTVKIDPTSVTKQAFGSKETFGDWFGGPDNLLSFMNEKGPEAVVPMDKVGEFINDMVAKNPGMLSGLQGSLRNSMIESNPNLVIQKVMEQFASSINIPSTISPANTGSAFGAAGTLVETKTTSDLLTALEKLNTKMDTLITAVEDGANANVNAVKRKGNLIA